MSNPTTTLLSEATPITLSNSQRNQIAEILKRRANEIAGYKTAHSCETYPSRIDPKDQMPASVEFGLDREIKRLRDLAGLLEVQRPAHPDDDETGD